MSLNLTEKKNVIFTTVHTLRWKYKTKIYCFFCFRPISSVWKLFLFRRTLLPVLRRFELHSDSRILRPKRRAGIRGAEIDCLPARSFLASRLDPFGSKHLYLLALIFENKNDNFFNTYQNFRQEQEIFVSSVIETRTN